MIEELDIGGVYVSPVLGTVVLALIFAGILTRLVRRAGLYRWVWHPHLFDLAAFILAFGLATAVLRELQ
jgi:hypothetical protein